MRVSILRSAIPETKKRLIVFYSADSIYLATQPPVEEIPRQRGIRLCGATPRIGYAMRCEYTAPGYLSDRSRSKAININDRLTEGLRSFLRQIVPNATADEAVSIFAREFRAIRRVARMWRTVCITFKGESAQ